MYIYREEKYCNLTYYTKHYVDENGSTTQVKLVNIPLHHIEIDEFTYIVLSSSNMNANLGFYDYINERKKDATPNTRKKIAHSIKTLHSFLELQDCSLQEFNENQAHELVDFLAGRVNNKNSYNSLTQRNNETINAFLGIFRQYFNYLGYKDNPLNKACFQPQRFGVYDAPAYNKGKVYTFNLPEYNKMRIIPKYITPEQYINLKKYVQEKEELGAEILLELMYEHGLRLGEVLGLTLEDIYCHDEDNIFLILRNRKSDQNFQYSKNLPHVTSVKEYKNGFYQKSFEQIKIDLDLFNKITEYIEIKHPTAAESYPENYKGTQADIVTKNFQHDENHYIFLHKQGKILNDQTWNNYLRKLYLLHSIIVDENKKEYNLSHRLRHGFAMFHAHHKENPVSQLMLQELLRHKDINSSDIYYNPTLEDELQVKTDFQDYIENYYSNIKEGEKDDE